MQIKFEKNFLKFCQIFLPKIKILIFGKILEIWKFGNWPNLEIWQIWKLAKLSKLAKI